MNIKNSINFIRAVLYLQAVIRSGAICRTASVNGIKAANLSKILNLLEKEIGCRLLDRTSRGVTPTKEGKKIYTIALELEHSLAQLEEISKTKLINPNRLNIYISKELKIECLDEFFEKNKHINFIFTEDEFSADLAVLNHYPDTPDCSYTHCTIGKEIKQNIWITCCEKHPSALSLYDFIIAKLLA